MSMRILCDNIQNDLINRPKIWVILNYSGKIQIFRFFNVYCISVCVWSRGLTQHHHRKFSRIPPTLVGLSPKYCVQNFYLQRLNNGQSLNTVWSSTSKPCSNEFILLQGRSVLVVFNCLIANKIGISFSSNARFSSARTLLIENNVSKYLFNLKFLSLNFFSKTSSFPSRKLFYHLLHVVVIRGVRRQSMLHTTLETEIL
jgi:hypothetical protein